MHRGSCLCGAVAFTIHAELTDPLTCHCKQCRRQSGHYFAAAHAPERAITFIRDDGLSWYRASETARRGFCKSCGSSLFWRADRGTNIAVAMAALDSPTGLQLGRHVWVNAKGDYYDLADGLPQQEGFEA